MEYEGLHRKAQRSKYDCLLFDLDDTLYSLSSGLATACRKNIEGYMAEKLEMDKSTIPEMCYLLYKTYGTTMAGLRAIGYDFDYDEYHSYVHGRLPYENLKPDPVLRNLLLASPLRKVIFTNADKIHAAKALSRLGLEDCFEGIICFETLNPSQNPPAKIQGSRQTTSTPFDILEHFARPNASTDDLPNTPIRCKPSQIAIEAALKLVNIDPQRTLFFDDSVRNIEAEKQVGLHTVIAGTCHRSKGAYFALESIHNIKEALPELLEEEAEKSDDVRFRLGLLASLTVHSLP